MALLGVGERLSRLVFPTNCLGCDLEGDWICKQCLRRLDTLRAERCAICKKAAQNGICQKCRGVTKIDGVISLFSYQNPVVKQLIQTKYVGSFQAIEQIVRTISREIYRRLPQEEITYCFVPQSRDRSNERGFNPSEIIARALADTDQLFTNIKKTRETKHQASLNKQERLLNLRSAFKINSKYKLSGTVAVCDDLITTGTTISRIAAELKRRGAEKVWAITIAHD